MARPFRYKGLGKPPEKTYQEYYPGDLPTANQDDLGPVRDQLFGEAVGFIQQDPRFAHVRFDGTTTPPAGGGEELPLEPPEEPRQPRPFKRKGVSVSGDADPTWGDYGRSLMAGGASIGSGAGWLLEQMGAEGVGEALQDVSNDAVKYWLSGLSEQAKAAMQQELLDPDKGFAGAKFNKLKLMTVQSLLGTAAGMGIGSVLTKGLGALGSAANIGKLTTTATTAAGTTATIPSKLAGAIGYGVGETAVAAPSAGAGVKSQIMDMTHEQLMEQSIEYQLLYENSELLSHDAKHKYAQEVVAAAAAGDAAALTSVLTFLASAPAGYAMSKLLTGNALIEGGGRIAATARGAGGEALQEFVQSGGEKVASNIGMKYAGGFSEQGVWEGALEEALGGAGSGGIMGGTMGALQRPGMGDATPPADKEMDPAIRAALEKEAEGSQLSTPEFSDSEGAEQGALPLSTPTPEEGQATTAPPDSIPTEPPPPPGGTPAPEAAPTPEAAPVEDQVVTGEDLVTEPTPTPEQEAAPVVEEQIPESPFIDAKEVTKGLREIGKKEKNAMLPIRKAFKSLHKALVAKFGDVVPDISKGVGAPGMGKFFEALDEQVNIDETLPNLKEFLRALVEAPDTASAVRAIENLASYVDSTVEHVAGAADVPILQQANEVLTTFKSFERDRWSKTTTRKSKKGEKKFASGRKGFHIPDRIEAVDKLRTMYKDLAEYAAKIGAQGLDNIEAVEGQLTAVKTWLKQWDTARPKILKSGAGSMTLGGMTATGKKLDKAQETLIKAIEQLSENIAAAEANPELQKIREEEKIERVEDMEIEAQQRRRKKKIKEATQAEALERRDRAEERMLAEADDNADRVYSGDDYVPPSDLVEEETEGETPNPAQAANIQRLLEFVQQVQVWPAKKAAQSKVRLAYHFRDVGDVVARGWLNDKVVGDLLEIFGAKKGATLKETRDNLMVATYEVVKADRAERAKEELLAEADDNADKVFSGDDYVPPSDLEEEPKKEVKVTVKRKGKRTKKETLKVVTDEGETVSQPIINDIIRRAETAEQRAELSYNDLRRLAKHLGIKATGKKVDILAAVESWHKGAEAETPEEDTVFDASDIKPSRSGKGSWKFTTALDRDKETQTLDSALNEYGIDTKDFDFLYSLAKTIKQKSPEKYRDFMRAILSYVSRPLDAGGEFISLVAKVEDALGGAMPNELRDQLGAFLQQIHERVLADRALNMEEQAETGMTPEEVEDAEYIIETTQGDFGESTAYTITEEGMNQDDDLSDIERGVEKGDLYNVKITDGDTNFKKAAKNRWFNPLAKAINRILGWRRNRAVKAKLFELYNSKATIRAINSFKDALVQDGKPTALYHFLEEKLNSGTNAIEKTSINEFLDAMIDSLPSNHRFYWLAKRLRQLDLDVPIFLFDNQLAINIAFASGEGITPESLTTDYRGFFHHGGKDTDMYSNRYIVSSFEGYEGVNSSPLAMTDFFDTLLHEIVHAATVQALVTKPQFEKKMRELYWETLGYMQNNDPQLYKALEKGELPKTNAFYGMTDLSEFVAEALTNPVFQQYLAQIPYEESYGVRGATMRHLPRKHTSILRMFFKAVKNVLGVSVRNTVLEEVVVWSSYGMSNELTQATTAFELNQRKQLEEERIEQWEENEDVVFGEDFDYLNQQLSPKEVTPAAADKFSKEFSSSTNNMLQKINNNIMGKLKGLKDKSLQGWLAIAHRDMIERDFRRLFDKAADNLGIRGNPVTRYHQAKNRASAEASRFEKKAWRMINSVRNYTQEIKTELGALMRDITIANIDPSVPLNHDKNQHIWRTYEREDKTLPIDPKTGKHPKRPYKREIPAKQKEKAIKARAAYKDFQSRHPKTAKMLAQMANLTQQIHDTKIGASMQALGQLFEFDPAIVRALKQARTPEDIDKILQPDDWAQIKAAEQAAESKRAEDTVEQFELPLEDTRTKEQKQESEKEKKAREADARARSVAATSAKQILHESSIKGWYFPLRRYGQYVVSTGPDVTKADEMLMATFESRADAEEYLRENPYVERTDKNGNVEKFKLQLSYKIRPHSPPHHIQAVAGDMLKRLPGYKEEGGEDSINKAAAERLKGALSELLAFNAAYQSTLKRKNIEGVRPEDMLPGFEEYVHISKYTIGDLLTTYDVASAIKDMHLIQADPLGADLTNSESVTAGLVIRELGNQERVEAKNRERLLIQEALGTIGFLNYLGAPSYWTLNMTQTYTVTVPYLNAKWGLRGVRKLVTAQGVIAKAVAKTLADGNPSYEKFKDNLPPSAKKLVDALELQNIIQSTIAQEFGDILRQSWINRARDKAALAPAAKSIHLAMQVMQQVPEAIEHFNRISTAMAVYELSKGDIVETQDAVNITQMNYDSSNRGRLWKSLPGLEGGGRGFVTPALMFKTYGFGIAHMMYGSVIRSLYRKEGRVEAMKLSAGLIFTHTLFGGARGGMSMFPLAVLFAAVNAVFREEGDEFDLEEALGELAQEHAGDMASVAVRKGVPAAVLGIDLSNSINLGNLIWMSDERFDPEDPQSIAKRFAELTTGPIGAWAFGAGAETAKILKDSPDKNWLEFFAAAVPVKFIKGSLQTINYSLEGLRTSGHLQLLEPKDFNAIHHVLAASGFQTTLKSDTLQTYWDDRNKERKRAQRRIRLLGHYINAMERDSNAKLIKTLEQIDAFNKSLHADERKYRIHGGSIAEARLRRVKAQREYDRKYNKRN